MSNNSDKSLSNKGLKDEPVPVRARQLHNLLRLSHIFSSVVREILEAKLLAETSTLPLTVSQFHILKLMTLNGHHQAGELAEFLGVSAPAATKNIDKLERFGLIVRSPSPDDRRATILSASQKGRRLVEKYEELKATRLYPILEQFDSEEIDHLSELLERFSVSLLQHEKTSRGFCLRCAAYIETGCPVGHVRGGCPYDELRELHPKNGAKK
jgi:DNA-binding MarR family transcriptional regulator